MSMERAGLLTTGTFRRQFNNLQLIPEPIPNPGQLRWRRCSPTRCPPASAIPLIAQRISLSLAGDNRQAVLRRTLLHLAFASAQPSAD